MPSIRTRVLSTLLCVLVATPALAKGKKSTGHAASNKASAEKHSNWVERSDPKGFTIKLPGVAEEKRDEWSTSYAVPLAEDAVKLHATINVEPLDELTPVKSLDKAVEAAIKNRPRGAPPPNVAEQREVPGGFLVVIGPDYDTYAVDVTRNGKELQLKAHCAGPSSHLNELKAMCLSVKPTK